MILSCLADRSYLKHRNKHRWSRAIGIPYPTIDNILRRLRGNGLVRYISGREYEVTLIGSLYAARYGWDDHYKVDK